MIENTSSKPSICLRSNDELLGDLDVALRNAHTYGISDPGLGLIGEIKEIHKEIQRRSIELGAFMESLNQATGWLMDQFLEDCLAFPAREPLMRNRSGLRIRLLCWHCGENECPEDDETFFLCTPCLAVALRALREKNGELGFMVFRTFSVGYRCAHADSETVLASSADDGFWRDPWCEQCLIAELSRRGIDKDVVPPKLD